MKDWLRWFRRLAGPLGGAGSAAGLAFTGLPPELVGFFAGSVGQAAVELASGRSREAVVADVATRPQREDAYTRFGRSVGIVWYCAGMLMIFRPKFVGYLHGLLYLMRMQKHLEDHTLLMIEATTDVFMYGSAETQREAVSVVKALGSSFRQLGACKQGSAEASAAFERLSPELGDNVVRWRRSAQADLAVK